LIELFRGHLQKIRYLAMLDISTIIDCRYVIKHGKNAECVCLCVCVNRGNTYLRYSDLIQNFFTYKNGCMGRTDFGKPAFSLMFCKIKEEQIFR
jgi:hypothetical protein